MANVLINEQYLTDIANSIRRVSGVNDKYTPDKMAAAIANSVDTFSFDSLIDKTFSGEFYTKTTDVIPAEYMAGMKNIPSATGLAATEIGEYAFGGCESLVSANFPMVTEIGKNAFRGCHSLTDISLPNAWYLRESVFGDCWNLKKLDLPVVRSIGFNATKTYMNFGSGMTKLDTIILRSPWVVDLPTTTNCYQNNFWHPNVWGVTSEVWFYVPGNLLSQYQSKYSFLHFRAIEHYPEICG